MTLHIYDRRERALVSAGDAMLTGLAALARPFRRRRRPPAPARILLVRLERIGDLLMTLPAIADVRAAAPGAEIDLAVGGWNAEVARSVSGVSTVHVVDAPWLARENAGASIGPLLRTAIGWRKRRYDLAVNFEPDIRSNAILALSGARWTAGYRSAGGGPLLDQALDYQPGEHTVDNARRLAHAVLGGAPATAVRMLAIPEADRREAEALLAGGRRPFVAMHVAGGRPVKQWDPRHFTEVARHLIESRGATIFLTGSPDDAALISQVKTGLPAGRAVDLSGVSSLLTVAAVLECCDLMITGDTGPMHLAAAVGTPIVAVFGPSDPRRYAPQGPRDRVIRVDLPCAPCNRIRLPPARCTGRIPDCLALVTPDRVLGAALTILDECHQRRTAPA
ncbi:glycosyltransferase family 9 protein [soil metagenome]